jgi:glycosyltransferase involved in cell wall biosynthesis
VKILHLCGEFRLPRDPATEGYSGVARATLELARTQAARGHQVCVASVGPEAWQTSWQGVEVRQLRRLPWAQLKLAGRRLDLSVHLPYLLFTRQHRFDVLHGQMYPSLRGLRGPGRVTTFHSDPGDLPAAVVRGAVASSQVQIGVSDFVTAGLRRLAGGQGDMQTVPNGVDLAQFGPGLSQDKAGRWQEDRARLRQSWRVPEGGVVVLFAGAIVPEKGVLLLSQAFSRLAERRPDFHLTGLYLALAGDSKLWDLTGSAHLSGASSPQPFGEQPQSFDGQPQSFDEQVDAALSAASQRGQVHRLGRVAAADMAAVYAACDVLVVPSLVAETFSLSGLEAMASGLPLIVADSGALPDLVAGGAGLLFPSGDENALEEALEQLAGDPELRGKAGRLALAHAQSLSWEAAATRLDEIYRRCLGLQAVGQSISVSSSPPPSSPDPRHPGV